MNVVIVFRDCQEIEVYDEIVGVFNTIEEARKICSKYGSYNYDSVTDTYFGVDNKLLYWEYHFSIFELGRNYIDT